MKITVYYEDKNHPTILDVPDEDCEIWIEDDYRRRLFAAEDKSSVTRRTAQEMMDEDYYKPTFDSHHRETRRHVFLEAFDLDGNRFVGVDDVETETCRDDYADLHRTISRLKPKQRDLIKKVFWEDIKQVKLAKAEDISESTIVQRMEIKNFFKNFKKILVFAFFVAYIEGKILTFFSSLNF